MSRIKAPTLNLEELIRELLIRLEVLTNNNAKLSSALDDALHELKRYREKAEELAVHIKRMNEVPTQFASGPLWMSEEEEDARYQHESGGLNGEMLREKLLELGLDPEITNEG